VQTGNEPFVIEEQGWTVRVQPPKDRTTSPRTLLLLHGWTGDENVMWIFTNRLPSNLWMFAPRAPYASTIGGYSWLPPEVRQGRPSDGFLPDLDEFRPVADRLLQAFEHWTVKAGAPSDTFDVMGFSQGAAMCYALAAFYTQRVGRILALAGFTPRSEPAPGAYTALAGKPLYIAHGSKDETVPVQLAQQTVRMLQSVGADVTYCESEVGHKLSAQCLKGIESFYSR
jgi:phospholipase/carboxylesterase